LPHSNPEWFSLSGVGWKRGHYIGVFYASQQVLAHTHSKDFVAAKLSSLTATSTIRSEKRGHSSGHTYIISIPLIKLNIEN